MVKKLALLYLPFTILYMVAACSPRQTVNTNIYTDVDFSNYDSFAYLPVDDTATHTVFLEEKIIQEVNKQMDNRGYKLDNERPDLLVMVKTMLKKEERFRREPIRTNYNYNAPSIHNGSTLGPVYFRDLPAVSRVNAFSEAIREVAYTEGTFVIDVIERANNQIIWRGWSETPIDQTQLENSIRNYISTIFEEYPEPAN